MNLDFGTYPRRLASLSATPSRNGKGTSFGAQLGPLSCFQIYPAVILVLLAVVLLGLPGRAQAKAKAHHASYTPSPTETQLFDALRKAVYGSQKDRSAADALFRRVLRYDTVEPLSRVAYPVYGASPEEIRSLQAQSKAQAGISEWGYTYSKWSYGYQTNGPVHLTLQTSMTMPEWRSNGQGRAAAPSFWRDFLRRPSLS